MSWFEKNRILLEWKEPLVLSRRRFNPKILFERKNLILLFFSLIIFWLSVYYFSKWNFSVIQSFFISLIFLVFFTALGWWTYWVRSPLVEIREEYIRRKYWEDQEIWLYTDIIKVWFGKTKISQIEYPTLNFITKKNHTIEIGIDNNQTMEALKKVIHIKIH